MRSIRRQRTLGIALSSGLAVLLGIAISQGTHAKTELYDLDGARAEVYKSASGDKLRLYIFEPEGHDPTKDTRPAIVFFFGGGWNNGTPAQFEQHCRYLASRGMVAVSADYRVKSRQGTPPKECVADGKSAVRYLRANAGRLGIDPNRIAAGGGSAGGHVAAAAGMVEGFDDEADADLSVSSKPNALVLFNPVYDNSPEGYGADRVQAWFPGISPAQNITKDDPPTVVFLGTEDRLIPVATARRFQAEMQALGLRSELHLYEGQPHGFFNQPKGGEQIFVDTLLKMDQFLGEIGFLQGEPNPVKMEMVAQEKTAATEKPKRNASQPAK